MLHVAKIIQECVHDDYLYNIMLCECRSGITYVTSKTVSNLLDSALQFLMTYFKDM